MITNHLCMDWLHLVSLPHSIHTNVSCFVLNFITNWRFVPRAIYLHFSAIKGFFFGCKIHSCSRVQNKLQLFFFDISVHFDKRHTERLLGRLLGRTVYRKIDINIERLYLLNYFDMFNTLKSPIFFGYRKYYMFFKYRTALRFFIIIIIIIIVGVV